MPSLAESLRRFRNHGIDTTPAQRHASGQWHYEMVDARLQLPPARHRLRARVCRNSESWRQTWPAAAKSPRDTPKRFSRDSPSVVVPSCASGRESRLASVPDPARPAKAERRSRPDFPALRAENIGVNVHYIPVHLHPYYRDRFGFRAAITRSRRHAYEAPDQPADVSRHDGARC